MRELRSRLRMLLLLTPWVSIPLALLGAVYLLALPVALLVGGGWVAYGIALVAAMLIAVAVRRRYRLAVLDSSPLGVVYWLQRR